MNTYGWSLDSQPNSSGATIETEPTQMTSPVYDPAGATVDSYHLQWDSGTSTGT
jgi:hypothetical protein